MLNLVESDCTLKITWLSKLLTTDPDWKEFPCKYTIDIILFTDSTHHKKIIAGIKRSVAESYMNWYKTFRQTIEIYKYKIRIPIWAYQKLFKVGYRMMAIID